jgi:hypothetical protein
MQAGFPQSQRSSTDWSFEAPQSSKCTLAAGMRTHFLKALSKQSKHCLESPEHRKSVSEWGLGIEIPRFFRDDLVSVITQG